MFTNTGASSILRYLVGEEGSGSLSGYLALSTTAPGKDGSNVTEPSSESGYKRVMIGTTNSSYSNINYFGTPVTNDAGVTEISNTSQIHFDEVLSTWGTLTHFAIYRSATGGTPIYVGELKASLTPTVNSIVIIRAGEMKISLE